MDGEDKSQRGGRGEEGYGGSRERKRSGEGHGAGGGGGEGRAEVGVTGKSCTREHCSDSGRGRSSCIRLHCKPVSQGGVPRGGRERPSPRLEAVLTLRYILHYPLHLICLTLHTLLHTIFHSFFPIFPFHYNTLVTVTRTYLTFTSQTKASTIWYSFYAEPKSDTDFERS